MVILITGAGRGIGAGLALEFAREAHTLLLVSRSRTRIEALTEQCNELAGKNVTHPIVFDINDLDNLESEFSSLIAKNSKVIDAIINNAGYMVRKPFEQISGEEIRTIFSANVTAPANLIRIALPFLRRSDHAHVVNITSMAGFQGSVKFGGLSFYSASKAALASLTECLAEEFKHEKISFNSLALGSVQTEMLNEAFPGFKAPLSPAEMAVFIKWFALNGHRYFNGKHLPVSLSTP